MIAHITIDAPLEKVFEKLIVPDYRMLWGKNVFNIRYDAGASPDAPGASFVQVHKEQGRTLSFKGKNLVVEAPHMYRYQLSDRKYELVALYRLVNLHTGTLVQLSAEMNGRNPFASMLGRFVSQARLRMACEDLATLKKLCESA